MSDNNPVEGDNVTLTCRSITKERSYWFANHLDQEVELVTELNSTLGIGNTIVEMI